MSWDDTPKALLTAVLGAAWMLAPGSSPVAASDLEDGNDFAVIAKDGLQWTVDGAFFADPQRTRFPNLQPDAGRSVNLFAWSMAWHENALWLGTGDICGDLELCQGGQIWRYRPSSSDEGGDWGLSGVWDLMFEPPRVRPVIGLSDAVPRDTPRDFGYRAMATCDAGDGISRLYVGTFGIPGHILYYDGTTFQKTSDRGLFNGLGDLAAVTFEMGYRALACYRGRLWASPIGYLQPAPHVDSSLHPVIQMNPDPAGGAPWELMVNVSDPDSHPLADPGNSVIFQAEVVGDYIYFAVANRTTGLELWRGDGRHCPLPWESDGPCRMIWTKIIDNGAGRPPDSLGDAVDNAGATLGVFGNDLYLGVTDAASEGRSIAELIRVPNAGSAPAADPRVPHQWELLAGWPRRNYAKPAERLPGLENLWCGNPGDMSDSAPPFWTESFTALDDDAEADDCLPSTGMGPGLNLELPDPQYAGLKLGPGGYLWRFADHQNAVFMSRLDLYGDLAPVPLGASLLKSADGISWTAVTEDGFGDPTNFGIRTLLSLPGIGLAVGTLNFERGAQVLIGTTAPAGRVPPVIDGGSDRLIFDEDQDETVEAALDGGASFAPFGGAIAGYEWFEGSLADLGATCANLDANDAFSTEASTQVALASKIGDQDVVEHRFTLRVTDLGGAVNCDEVRITASYNLPPGVMVTPGLPFASGPSLRLLDVDGDGVEHYDLTGLCTDPEHAIVRCEWVSVDDPGVTFSNVRDTSRDKDLCHGADPCEVYATAEVPASGSPPAAYLEVEDDAGFTARLRWETDVQPVIDNPGVNDAPVCRSLVFYMEVGVDTVLEVDPAALSPPACVDPDGEPLTYRIQSVPAEGQAAANGTLVYTPDDPGTAMVDGFDYDALDPAGADAPDAAVRVVLDDDETAPTVAVSFPEDGGVYNNVGCGTLEEQICGTAADDSSGLGSVELAIRDAAGRHWDARAGAFVDTAGPIWNPAVGSRYWHLPFTPPANGDYALMARSFDLAGFQSPTEEIGFSYFSAGPDGERPLLARILARLFGL
ncbi:MAG: hypothetical protein PVF91_07380 [Chromatiales bacterium]|jgi:hypothetical protein